MAHAQKHFSTPNASAYSAATSSTKRALEKAYQLGVLYADDDWSPLSDLTLALLLKRAGVRWEYAPLDGLCEIVTPPVCGIHLMLVEGSQTSAEKRFAVRHGLGHVLAGHVEEACFVRDRDPFSHEERVADLFAFADLIPDRLLTELRKSKYRPWEIEYWLTEEVRRYCPSWSFRRIVDRMNMLMPLP